MLYLAQITQIKQVSVKYIIKPQFVSKGMGKSFLEAGWSVYKKGIGLQKAKKIIVPLGVVMEPLDALYALKSIGLSIH